MLVLEHCTVDGSPGGQSLLSGYISISLLHFFALSFPLVIFSVKPSSSLFLIVLIYSLLIRSPLPTPLGIVDFIILSTSVESSHP